MTKEFYEECYKNGELRECMPIDLGYVGFVFQDIPQDDEDERERDEFQTRLFAYVPKNNITGEFASIRWNGVGDAYISAKDHSLIVCNEAFMLNEAKSKTGWYDTPNNEKAHLAKGIKNIDEEVYAYGMVRSVFKYKGVKEWENITTKTKHPNLYSGVETSTETFVGDWVGFSALDGFNANDIYAGGNQGDFWHYNGQKWRRVDLPINSDISTITCGKDGKVYVGSRLGSVAVGRDNEWKVIDKFKEITYSCWFDDKVYLSSKDGRIYTYQEGKKELVEASFKTKYPSYMHHLIRGIASCDECLVIYTAVQAYAYDGEIWHEIIEIPSLTKHK